MAPPSPTRGARGNAAYLLVTRELFEQVATERRRISPLAQAAADGNSWYEFSEVALCGTGALARRWAKVGEAALLADVASGGFTRFDPVELVATLRRKGRAAWNASDTLDGGTQLARLLPFTGLPVPTRAEVRHACASFPSRAALPEGAHPRLFVRAGSATLGVLLARLCAMEAAAQAPPTQRAQRRPILIYGACQRIWGRQGEATCPQLVGAGSVSLPCPDGCSRRRQVSHPRMGVWRLHVNAAASSARGGTNVSILSGIARCFDTAP